MTASPKNPADKAGYSQRFQTFIFKMVDVSQCAPKERYLYPIMDSVPFRDLEVALNLAMLNYAKANDNKE